MSGNVINNLKAFPNVETWHMKNDNAIYKTRFVDEKTNQMLVRVDKGEDNVDRISKSRFNDVMNIFKPDAIIISDYNKGFVNEEDIEYIVNSHNEVIIDTKKLLGEWALNAKFIKLNEYEYKASKHLIKALALEDQLLITLGGKGTQYRGKIIPVDKVQVKDQTGAGDTFVAAFTVSYLEEKIMGKITSSEINIESCIGYANKCARSVVLKRGVGILDLNDTLD
jgi:bifunctional ADP-heptose synthase (sugar kinase/adenylyltransferase)